jgi:hypothetical protein
MSFAVKIALAAAGFYLFAGMLIGIVKYRATMQSAEHRAPVYIDVAHRAAFYYSFAALVLAKLLEDNALPAMAALAAVLVVLFFFTVTIGGYFIAGWRNRTDNLFRQRNFVTTWFMYGLIAGEAGGLLVIFGGFLLKLMKD